MHVSNRVLVLELGYFLIECPDYKVGNLFPKLGYKLLSMVTKHDITLHVAGGLGKYLHCFDIGQRAIHGNLGYRPVLGLGLL